MTTIYEAADHLLIHAGYADPAEHRHMAAHIIVATAGELTVLSQGREHPCRGVMIPSGVSHRIRTTGPALVFLYDSTTGIAARITEIHPIPAEVCHTIAERYARFEQQGDYGLFLADALTRLGLGTPPCPVTDGRIQAAMDFIRAHAAEPITCRDIAEAVFLSPSRFSHLFREQTGMTVPAYLIYQRLMAVYAQVIRGRSITESAISAGFSGSSHFADVSRRVFGLRATEITRGLRFRRVS